MQGIEYQFAVKKCIRCGRQLSGKHVELAGMKGPLPMGYCPKCGTAYKLDEVESEPETKPPEEPTEPEEKPSEEPTEE